MPWPDDHFDVVTSFRGLWATTREALAEAHRVLRPGGRISVTTWGHVKASPGAWALAPFTLAEQSKVEAQAEMVYLGRPGAGEQILAEAGFVGARRHIVPFAWEFPDAETYARMLASTGPAYEAIQAVGEEEFRRVCLDVAEERMREGLPLRAEIDCVGFTASVPTTASSHEDIVLGTPSDPTRGQALAEDDLATLSFVTNVVKLWMHEPAAFEALFDLIDTSARGAGLSFAERGIAVVTGTLLAGDTYCPLAWGQKLAGATSVETAVAVLAGDAENLDDRGRAIAAWARHLVTTPTERGHALVDRLREVGFDESQIVWLSLFVAQRVAFSTVNGVLGARPEQEYLDYVDPQVREAWAAAVGGPS